MSKPQQSKTQQQHIEPKAIDWQRLRSAAGPYPIEAFQFVREGLGHVANHVHPDPEAMPETGRHISGQQLCLGLRDYAIEQYGLLAPVVLRHWHVRRTDDFGRIVFAMIAEGLMSKTDDDTMDDFRSVYDFDEAFSAPELTARIACG